MPEAPPIEAVVFDWGGTLTAWHDIDFHAESVALAQAVRTTPTPEDDHHAWAARGGSATSRTCWSTSNDLVAHLQVYAGQIPEVGNPSTPFGADCMIVHVGSSTPHSEPDTR